jgi:hypothetical protein
VIPEHEELNASKVKRVIMCSGKVYYDLVNKRKSAVHDTAIIRVEQLYPFPHKAVAAELKKYPNATEIVWCQDEPQNQGAWFFVQHYIHGKHDGRPEARLCRSSRLGFAGGGLLRKAQRATEGAAGRCVRQAQGLCSDQVIRRHPRRAPGCAPRVSLPATKHTHTSRNSNHGYR